MADGEEMTARLNPDLQRHLANLEAPGELLLRDIRMVAENLIALSEQLNILIQRLERKGVI